MSAQEENLALELDAAWKKLTPAQKAATNRKKKKGSKAGKQHVKNTPAAKKASKRARGKK